MTDRTAGALWGLFIGDALAMPVHWYYDRAALRRDYGEVRDYLAPRNPHPDSILWRSSYQPENPDADILHDQAQYWGRPGVHYHQFLQAGENTLNLQLVRLLLEQIAAGGAYDPDRYLQGMVGFLRTPGAHRDTYAEEWLRGFFTNRARGHDLRRCAVKEKHVGGLAGPIALLVLGHREPGLARRAAHAHLQLTHVGPLMDAALDTVADILLPVLAGDSLRATIDAILDRGRSPLLQKPLRSWDRLDDLEVIGRKLSPACYVDDAVPAVVHLARRHHADPERALVANTMAGGDNCYRGAVLGALLGAAHGLEGWPRRWRDGLRQPPPSPPAG
ncbi:MAG: ADP-ribosylglycohydrolase family protein [Candidatus Krumholzibacteriia bacterium]